MDFKQIRYFVAIAEAGSFSAGARRAFVTQPTLSAAIAALEAELGFALLERHGSRRGAKKCWRPRGRFCAKPNSSRLCPAASRRAGRCGLEFCRRFRRPSWPNALNE